MHLVLSMQVTGRQASLLTGCGGWVQSYPTEGPKIFNVFMPVILLRNVLIVVELHGSFYCIYLINRLSQVFYAMNDFYIDRVGKKTTQNVWWSEIMFVHSHCFEFDFKHEYVLPRPYEITSRSLNSAPDLGGFFHHSKCVCLH